ncbi:MAG: 3-phosphoserine/phosphohydroxythreonine transaminase [Ignavibacteriae bacterium]|nr:3-phosphoserine/phosphohydroxythreonine transaminase [Ignavibacteriota bacterium]MCB9221689.1 3-phosphoserine/phosphohydroxythreonine transaminase [Ignavibacteria bacterium]
MNRVHNFSAGPATLPVAVLNAAKQACVDYNGCGMSVMEMSHRSKEIVSLFDETKANILRLMNLSADDYSVLFLGGGASMQFAMIPLNFLKTSADYINTGVWSKKAIAEGKLVGNVNVAASSADKNFNYIPKEFSFDSNADYVHYTTNNTIYGTRVKDIPNVGNVPLVCDMSSDLFSRDMDFSKFDLIYAGAQKNIGPSGATLVVIKKSWVEKSEKDGNMTMLKYSTHIQADTMFNTPPVFPVFVINETLKWIESEGGLEAIEKKNNHKAGLLYDAIDNSNGFYKATVADKNDRSTMNVTFNLESEEKEAEFIKKADSLDMSGLKGHRSVGGVRASIYNACPLESVEALVKFMDDFRS